MDRSTHQKTLNFAQEIMRFRSSLIQLGRPKQNGYIERFNSIYRESILDAYLFFELDQVRTLTEEWIDEYNLRRPHESLGNLAPNEWKM
jgi:putative transposase